jgi:NAD(P)-dependent dehydrogenase (short-subunit alcohol dehydrogenase family)
MYPEPIIDADPARWRESFNVNVLALLEGSQAAVHKMRALRQPGHIVNFSSLVVRWDAGGVYGATKIAVEMITRTLRKELERDDIRVTTVVPGGFVSAIGRGFPPEITAALGEEISLQASPDRVLGDPGRIADLVAYVLGQPTDLNIGEVVIRSPVSLEY